MSKVQHKIIVVDDEVNILRSMESCLKTEGYQVDSYTDPVRAFMSMEDSFYDLAIIDIRLGEVCGIELFRKLKQEKIDIPVIFISSHASLSEAAETIKTGAYDFLEKPFTPDKLIVSVKNCVEYYRIRLRLKEVESLIETEDFIGEHQSMMQLRRDISKVAATESVVLIQGESGTGKELIAKSIHKHSKRSGNAFIKVNCSAIPSELLESALFGHVKGAFSGADKYKKGYFEAANGGTLFLDEIGDLPLKSQASLLRVIENREIQKVGSDRISSVDVRILAATHKDLKNEVELGGFRADLYYRINVVPMEIPPLRERISDIRFLIDYFVSIICKRNGFPLKTVDPECYKVLSAYSWPGNVRELYNIVERMVILGGKNLGTMDIPTEIILSERNKALQRDDLSLKELKRAAEREYIIKKLRQYKGNITKVAEILGIDRTHLHKKMTQYEIRRDNFFV